MDNAQLAAWLTRGHRALKDTLPPRTRKSFAGLMLDAGLWNSSRLSLHSAVARVGDCLNPGHGGGQSFKISEVWLWMRESGHHALFEAIAEDLGYRTEPVPSEQRQQDLLKRIDDRLATIIAEVSDLQAFRAQLTQPAADTSCVLTPASPVRFSQYEVGEAAF